MKYQIGKLILSAAAFLSTACLPIQTTEVSAAPALPQSAGITEARLVPVHIQSGQLKVHPVDSSFITSDMNGAFSESFLQDIREGRQKLYYSGSLEEARHSLSEVAYFYCSIPNGVQFYTGSDSRGTYLEITDACWNPLQAAVKTADQAWNSYKAEVREACWSLNLDTSDADLVDQINTYICRNYDYKVTNSGMPAFISSHLGQCWHYSKMFADMCNTVGIPAEQLENTDHAWNQVTVDGITYTFDVTYNDTSGNWNSYSWMNPSHPVSGANRWIQNTDGTWSYIGASGRLSRSSWIKSGGAWYYVDMNGIMLTRTWVRTSGKWYFLKDDGRMAVNTWIGRNWVNGNGEWIA